MIGACKHFNGIQHETCRVGVNYRSLVGGPDFGWATRMPCLRHAKNDETVTCALREMLTPEEEAAEEAEWKKRTDDVLTARRAIVKQTKRQRGIAGEIECPIDKGRLRFTVSGYNGHIHAACSNADCVRWME